MRGGRRPLLGEHTAQALAELGLDETEIELLEREGIASQASVVATSA